MVMYGYIWGMSEDLGFEGVLGCYIWVYVVMRRCKWGKLGVGVI